MSIILQILVSALILGGSIFMFIASVGIIRLPDFYTRNSASTKSISFGVALILVGVAVSYNETAVVLEILAMLLFIVIITPLSAHIIARTAIKTNVPFWEKTNTEELASFHQMHEAENDEEDRDS